MRDFVFFTHNKDTFSNPMLVSLFEDLQERGRITLFAPEQEFNKPRTLDSISVRKAPHIKYKFSLKPLIYLMIIINYIRLRKIINEFDECVLAGIDPKGFISAALYGKYFRSINKLGYISFEIFFMDELRHSNGSVIEKEWEIRCSEKVDFVVISDEERWGLLRKENSFRDDVEVFYVPVAPKRSVGPPSIKERSDPLKIVYSGSLDPAFGVDRLLDAIGSSDNRGLDMEFHSRYRLDENDHYRKRIRGLESDGVRIRLNDDVYHEQEEYLEYLSRFDVGVCFYLPSDEFGKYSNKNIKYIGLSSGKLSYYVMMGIPVLMYGSDQFEKLNNNYNFGHVLKQIDEVVGGVENIANEFENKRRGCELFYQEVLNPEKKLKHLLQYLDSGGTL